MSDLLSTLSSCVLMFAVGCSPVRGPSLVSTETMIPVTAPPATRCDGEGCRRACDAGDVRACTKVGDAIYVADRGAARALYEAACEKNDPVACARLFEESSTLRDARRFARRSCAAGGAGACSFLSEWTLLALLAPRPHERRAVLFARAEESSTRACDLGRFRSCLNAISLMRHRDTDDPRIEQLAGKALALAKADCTNKNAGACLFVADWALQAGDRPTALEHYSKQCAIERRVDRVVVDLNGVERPTRNRPPESCQKVAELGGDASTISGQNAALFKLKPFVVQQRAVEARRVSGRSQIQPDEFEAAVMRQRKEKSVTTYKLCLSERGGVTSIRSLRASSYPGWNRKLFETMRNWRYAPFTVDGRPVPVCTSVTFVYKPAGAE